MTNKVEPGGSIDPHEVARFSALAEEWWDPNGKFKPLHALNPARVAIIKNEICDHFGRDGLSPTALHGLRLLDIGCGGGLLSEPMARLGADVVGADAAERNISIARSHADQCGLSIDYRATTAEDLASAGEKFDVVVNCEVIEHVADAGVFARACGQLLKPGAIMVVATVNRTSSSFLKAIIGAEYVLRWLPRGTHDWNRFVRPAELVELMAEAGLEPGSKAGLTYRPLSGQWLRSSDLSVNYLYAFTNPV